MSWLSADGEKHHSMQLSEAFTVYSFTQVQDFTVYSFTQLQDFELRMIPSVILSNSQKNLLCIALLICKTLS